MEKSRCIACASFIKDIRKCGHTTFNVAMPEGAEYMRGECARFVDVDEYLAYLDERQKMYNPNNEE